MNLLKYLRKLFSKPSLEERSLVEGSGVINDQDFGIIQYVEPFEKDDEGFWQMEGEWVFPDNDAKIGCCEIPGDIGGPFEYARAFLVSKKLEISSLWSICEVELKKNIDQWYPEYQERNPREILFLSALALDSVETKEMGWEISFEAKDNYKWTFMSFQLKGNNIISGTVDT